MNKPVYGMSGTGNCSKALVAGRLGYEPITKTKDDEERLKYYTRLETVAAAQIKDMGYELEPSSLCLTCQEKYGIERHGIHVEIDTVLFDLVGHLDRRLILNGKRYPVEIKTLGRFIWPKFAKNEFSDFPNYAAQEACYLEAEQVPGVYWVMNRDTGQALKYIVNDYKDELNLPGFKKIYLPITIEQIIAKLDRVESFISGNELPEGDVLENCTYCDFRFLCHAPDKELVTLDTPSLVDAAKQYTEGHAMEKQAKSMKEAATFALLNHAKTAQVDKFKVQNVSFTYRGTKQSSYFDSKTFQAQNQEMYERYLKPKLPFDDYSIRILKGDE